MVDDQPGYFEQNKSLLTMTVSGRAKARSR
jgi:hypothetical protein